jgi:hypothetical protein
MQLQESFRKEIALAMLESSKSVTAEKWKSGRYVKDILRAVEYQDSSFPEFFNAWNTIDIGKALEKPNELFTEWEEISTHEQVKDGGIIVYSPKLTRNPNNWHIAIKAGGKILWEETYRKVDDSKDGSPIWKVYYPKKAPQ